MHRPFDKMYKVAVIMLLTIIACKNYSCKHITKTPVEVTQYCPKGVTGCKPMF